MKNQPAKLLSCCLLASSLVLFTGCGGGEERPATAPVTGSVMYNGEAIAGATVSFWTEGASRAATGVTKADGTFSLSMFDPNDGAIPGEHTITVVKVEAGAEPASTTDAMLNDPTAMAGMAAEGGAGGPKAPESLIPEKYSKKESSPLKETVSADAENKFIFQLAD